MEKAQRFLAELDAQQIIFPSKAGGKRWKTVMRSNFHSPDAFFCQLTQQECRIEAASPLAALYAYYRLQEASNLHSCQGLYQPRFSKRLLGLVPYSQEVLIPLTQEYELYLPAWCIDQHRLSLSGDAICQALIQWGFNGLILGFHRSSAPPAKAELEFAALNELVHLLKGYGLDLILAPYKKRAELPKPSHVQVLSTLFQQSNVSGVVLESQVPYLTRRPREVTLRDLLEEEFDVLQQAVSQLECYIHLSLPLQYDPISFSECLKAIPSLLLPETHLLFSNKSQVPWEYSQEDHPLWQQLYQAPRSWPCGVLPMIDAGAAGKGGGFWPLSNREEVEATLLRCQRHRFQGAVISSATLPVPNSLAALNLQHAGRRLWGKEEDSSAVYLQALEKFVVREKSCILGKLLESQKQLIEDVQRFCFESSQGGSLEREEAELLLAQLNQFQHRAQPFSHLIQFDYCYRDLRRFVMHELQKRQQPLPKSYLHQEEGGAGFWTEVEGGKMPAGYLASPRIRRLKVPLCGEEGSECRRLYAENDLLY